MSIVYLFTPPGARARLESESIKARLTDRLTNVSRLCVEVRERRSDYEHALWKAKHAADEGDEGRERMWKLRADAWKRHLASDAFELSIAVSELVADTLGTWRPDSTQVGTGLQEWQLRLIGEVSGMAEPAPCRREHVGPQGRLPL